MSGPSVPPSLNDWRSSPEYHQESLVVSTQRFLKVTDLLLENPNLNSTHLFRADILSDSAHVLKTNAEKEQATGQLNTLPNPVGNGCGNVENAMPAPRIDGAILKRTVLRRLIPRKQQLDEPLHQTCHVYDLRSGGHLVMYLPHVENEAAMPWYHPPVRALAYVFTTADSAAIAGEASAALSLRYLLFQFSDGPLPSRLHRTFLSLVNTFIRLAKNPSPTAGGQSSATKPSYNGQSMLPSALKDTIIPQHMVQDTYARLKQKYASDLIARWVEKTEPSKHVFEDIMIAAFLVELWKQMYHDTPFTSFVDIACGNGVLVYILIKEGYNGFGFDARRRKTWDVLGIEEHLDERILIPQPFLDILDITAQIALPITAVHNGIFTPNTFIISNHADELTPWTPILAAISSVYSPLPFLAMPCCSHSLSGAKHRYTPKDSRSPPKLNGTEDQAPSGDLKALRAQKVKEANHGNEKSMYACLTKKVAAIAEELGIDVELTLMRIPSTRNIGVIGNRRRVMRSGKGLEQQLQGLVLHAEDRSGTVQALIEHECSISCGVDAAARNWIERAQKLQVGKGRGKVNLGQKPDCQT